MPIMAPGGLFTMGRLPVCHATVAPLERVIYRDGKEPATVVEKKVQGKFVTESDAITAEFRPARGRGY